MKVLVDVSVEGPSTVAVKALVWQLASTTSSPLFTIPWSWKGLFKSKASSTQYESQSPESETPDFMSSIPFVRSLSKLDYRRCNVFTDAKRVMDSVHSVVAGECDAELYDLLQNFAKMLNSPGCNYRGRAFHIGQFLVLLNSIALVSGINLATTVATPSESQFPYNAKMLRLLDKWLKGERKLTFYVHGEAPPSRPEHPPAATSTVRARRADPTSTEAVLHPVFYRTLLLMQLLSVPGNVGEGFKDLETDAGEFFECYKEWARTTTDFSVPPQIAKLPLELEQLFYETKKSDPNRLHEVLNAIVDQTIERRHGRLLEDQLYDEKRKLFMDLRRVIAEHVFVLAWRLDPCLPCLDWGDKKRR